MNRTTTEQGERFPCRDGELILKEYPKEKSKEAHSVAFNKAVAYPHFGFRNEILENGNVLIIGFRNDKTSKTWDSATKKIV